MLRQDLRDRLHLEFTLSRLTEGDVMLLLQHYGLTSIEQINTVQFIVLSHFAATRLGGFHAKRLCTGSESGWHQRLNDLLTGISPSKEALRERQ